MYGMAGHVYSHTLGDGQSTIKYNKESDSLEFESNPFAIDSFTLGHTINYDTHPNQNYVSGYTGLYVNLGEHERHHIKQYDQTGILFPAFYLPNGLQSPQNPMEQQADFNAITNKK